MRKILLIFVSVILAFPQIYPIFAKEPDYGYEFPDSVSIAYQLGIIPRIDENEEFNENMVVLRKEFAAALINSYGENKLQTSGTMLSFSDVDLYDKYYDDIAAVVSMNLMKGYSAERFMPDEPITGIQAVKTIINALGYDIMAEYKGGYPSGYLSVAGEIKLLSGMSNFSYNENLTYKNFARLIINLLKTYPYEINGVKGNDYIYNHSDKTFGEKYMYVAYSEGVVNGNSEIMLVDHLKIDSGDMLIGAKVYSYGDYDDSYIGRNVEFFYSVNDITLNHIEAIAIRDNLNRELTIKGKDLVSGSLSYISYEENSITKKINISSGTLIVYNGNLQLSFDFSSLVNKDSCFITFIDNNGGGQYEVVLISDYNTLIVENVNADNGIITDKPSSFSSSLSGNSSEILKLDASYDNGKEIIIKTAGGRNIGIDGIKSPDVLSYYVNDSIVKIYVSSDIREMTVDSVEDDFIVSDGEYYPISSVVKNAKDIESGKIYTLYFDVFGKVAYYKAGVSEEYMLGYAIGCKYSDNEYSDSYYKFFNENGIFETLAIDEMFFINGEKYKGSSIPPAMSDDQGNFKRQLVRYKKSQNGELKEIITAEMGIASETSSFFRGPNIRTGMNKMYSSNYSYVTWNGIVNADQDTVIFVVPGDTTVTDESKFKIIPMTQMKILTYDIESYYTDINSQAADAIITFTDADVVNFDSNAGVVVKSSESINSEGDKVRLLTILANNVETKYECESSVNDIVSTFDVGDVLRYETDLSGKITDVSLIYDSSEKEYMLSSNPTSSSFVSSSRICYGKIVKISDRFVRVSYDLQKSYTPTEIYSLESFYPGRFTISIVREEAGRRVVSVGNESDIDIDDRVVIVMRSESSKAFVVIKD